MKVAHIFWGLSYGGIETMLVNIANAQVKEGADVYIIILNEMLEVSLVGALDPRVHLYCACRRRHSLSPWFLVRMNWYLHKIQPDAVHLHRGEFYRLIWSRRLSRVASVTLHALPVGTVRHGGALHCIFPILDITTPGNVLFYDIIPRVFTISEAVKDALWENYHIKSTVINNGILTSKFQPRTATAPHNPLRIVQVSRLDHNKKGQDLLIEAAAQLAGNIDVSFIGEGSSIDYLQQLTHERQAETFVHFLGKKHQDYIAAHLQNYDLFVQPSRYEGFGLTVAEAMAANVPVLVSAGQGPAEVTKGETFGWTFENGNADDLVNKLSYIIANYDEALTKAKNGRKHVIDTYDVSVTAKRYLQEYNS